jgi:hypothetical protein
MKAEACALVLQLFDRGVEIERIASTLRMSTIAVRMVVWAYRKAHS